MESDNSGQPVVDRQAMVSRSLRIHPDTLEVLKEQASIRGLGITVYIRTVLESLVENIKKENGGNG